jgi:putative flippase GtrA
VVGGTDLMAARRRTLFMFSQHQISSIVATGVDYVIMIALVSLLRLSPVLGTVVGALCGAVTSFTLGRQWVFGAGGGDLRGQAFRYAVVSAASLIGNTVGEALVVRHGTHYVAGRVAISIVVGMAWNFPMHRYFVFRAAPPPPPASDEATVSDDEAGARTVSRQTSS